MIDGDDRKIKYETTIMLLEDTRDNCYPMSLAHKDAINIAIETLEKNIPKEPMYKMVYGKRLTSEAYCIECGNTVFRNDDYCSKCGQAIDWSEVTE